MSIETLDPQKSSFPYTKPWIDNFSYESVRLDKEWIGINYKKK